MPQPSRRRAAVASANVPIVDFRQIHSSGMRHGFMTDECSEKSTKSAEILGLDRRQLLLRHLNGDPSAFTELVQLFQAQVYTYLIRCGVQENSRDDVFQEIFLTIHRHAASYKPDRPLAPWFFTIVANTVRTHYRRQTVSKLIYDTDATERANRNHTAFDIAAAQETAAWLETALKKLPFSQRESLLLCCIKDLDQRDVARMLGLSLNTLKTHLRRARLALAKGLKARRAKIENEAMP